MSRFRWTLTNLGDSTTETLSKDPIGWEEMALKLSRHKLYHGVFIDFTFSLKWHCNGGGKDFIDNVYNTEDIQGVIEVLIEMDCDHSGTYSELYRGRLNLASYRTDGRFTSCNIEKSDLFTKLQARDEISVDIETTESIGGSAITAPTLPVISMHSQKILLNSGMAGDVPFTATNDHAAIDSFVHRGLMFHTLTVTNNEADNFTPSTDFDDWGDPGNTANTSLLGEIFEAIDGNVDYAATYTYRVDFSGTMTDTVVGPQTRIVSAWSLVLAYGADLASSTKITIFNSGGYTSGSASHAESFDTTPLTGTINLNYGDKVWLYWFHSGTITTGPYNDSWNFSFQYDTASFEIEIDSQTADSDCKVALAHEAFNQVVDAIADENIRFYSEFYGRIDSEKLSYAENGCGSMVAITNGLNIREFEDKQIFCSLKELFQSLNALHNIGLTIENYSSPYGGSYDHIRVEALNFFYDNLTQILALARPVKVDIRNDNTRYINSVRIGYEKWEAEFKGGLDDPCAKHEYSTQVNAVKGSLSAMSKYIASGYAIEFTRRKNSKLERTEDWRYDNENFCIAVKDYYRGEMRFFATGNAVVISLPLGMIQDGDTLVITGTASNDGTYTVDHTETHPLGIAVYLVEAVVNETVTTATLEDVTNPIYQTEKYADSFSSGSGMIQLETAYNLRLTPARMLLAHVGVITACLQKIQGVIKFIKGEGNTALALAKDDVGCQEDFSGVAIGESDDVAWNEANAANIVPLWVPEILQFEYPLSLADINAIRANPHGYVTVTDESGTAHNGFILDVEYKIKTGVTKFELLRMP